MSLLLLVVVARLKSTVGNKLEHCYDKKREKKSSNKHVITCYYKQGRICDIFFPVFLKKNNNNGIKAESRCFAHRRPWLPEPTGLNNVNNNKPALLRSARASMQLAVRRPQKPGACAATQRPKTQTEQRAQ